MNDRDFLTDLHKSISKFTPAVGRNVGSVDTVRQLTLEEWWRVTGILGGEDVFAQLGTSRFGFGLAMTVWEHSAYPGGASPSPSVDFGRTLALVRALG